MRRQGLRTRLARLEGRDRNRVWPTFILAVYDDDTTQPVIGYQIGPDAIMRRLGEPLDAFQSRAWTPTPRLIVTMYGEPPSGKNHTLGTRLRAIRSDRNWWQADYPSARRNTQPSMKMSSLGKA